MNVDFFLYFIYTKNELGGLDVNEFENDVQSKNNDVVDSMKGFGYSFIFFILIFAIGVAISVIAS